MILVFDWNVAGGSALIAVALVSLGIAFWRISPVGAQTVQTLQDLLQARDHKIKALEAALDEESETLANEMKARHDAELAIKDRESELAALNERPNTEQMLRTFEAHHRENLELSHMSLKNQEAILEIARKTLEGVGAIIDKQVSDQSDQEAPK